MSRKRRVRMRRNVLLRQDPHCHYCGRRVYDYDGEYYRADNARHKRGPVPADLAVVDHVNSHNVYKTRPLQGRRVLACYECDKIRGQQQQLIRVLRRNWLDRRISW